MVFRCGKARLWELLAWLDTTHECQIKLPETWGFPGGRMDLGHCIFRGSFAKFGCQKWQVQIFNLNWALATVFNALYNPSCDTRLPQLRPKASTIPPVSTSRPFPLVHSHWSIPTEQNKQFEISLNFSFATFREANYFRDLSRPSISLSRKWCSITPLHKQYIEVFFVAHLANVNIKRNDSPTGNKPMCG